MKMNKFNFKKFKRKMLGFKFSDDWLFKFIIYFLLIIIGFVYLYPILHMVSYSFQSLADLLNPMVNKIPTKLYLNNYADAWRTLKYADTFFKSLLVTLVPALVQTLIASLVGYGFAKFDFPLKKMWMALLIATYIIPPQVTMIPKYVAFNDAGILGTIWSIILPATFGQGLNSAIFILIFYQFYKMLPAVLDEAAQIDGASRLYIYFKIAIPLSIPSFITSFLFSFVWYWNETYISTLFLGNNFKTLQMMLANFVSEYSSTIGGGTGDYVNEAIKMAATVLIILPMILVYFVLQRWFIEGIDKAGITGE